MIVVTMRKAAPAGPTPTSDPFGFPNVVEAITDRLRLEVGLQIWGPVVRDLAARGMPVGNIPEAILLAVPVWGEVSLIMSYEARAQVFAALEPTIRAHLWSMEKAGTRQVQVRGHARVGKAGTVTSVKPHSSTRRRAAPVQASLFARKGEEPGKFPALTTLNMGLGRDSITMLLLIIEKKLIVDGQALGPKDIDAVLFSDTGAEWAHTYAQIPRVRKLCEEHGIRFIILAKPPDEVWQANLRGFGDRTKPKWVQDAIDGKLSIEEKADLGAYHLRLPIVNEMMRYAKLATINSSSCTSNHKVGPLRRVMGDLSMERFGLTNRQWSHRVQKGDRRKHRVIIGIAADEDSRAIDTGRPHYERPVYPLVDMGIDKAGEVPILERWGMNDVMKSGCWMCPYQGLGWFWVLRETQPAEWDESVEYEAHAHRANPRMRIVMGKPPLSAATKMTTAAMGYKPAKGVTADSKEAKAARAVWGTTEEGAAWLAHWNEARDEIGRNWPTLAEGVEAWRRDNPDATIASVLEKSYSRCTKPLGDKAVKKTKKTKAKAKRQKAAKKRLVVLKT